MYGQISLQQIETIASSWKRKANERYHFHRNLIVFTDCRIFIVHNGIFRGLTIKEIKWEQIENLDTMMAEANENIAIHQEQIADAEAIAQAIEDEIEAQKNSVEKVKEEEERRKREEEAMRRKAHVKSMQMNAQRKETTVIFQDGLFNVNAKQKFSDKYEDEVFSVSDLPKPQRSAQGQRSGTRPAQRSRNSASGKR